MPISNFIFWLSRGDFLYYINFENDVFIDDEIDLRPISDILKIYLNNLFIINLYQLSFNLLKKNRDIVSYAGAKMKIYTIFFILILKKLEIIFILPWILPALKVIM